jgi:hypothetical protein
LVPPLSSSLSQIREEASKSNRANFKLVIPLDSPPSRTSDPRREFVDSRGKDLKVFIQILVDRSLNAVVSRRNALGNHRFILPRTHSYDLITFCWENPLVPEFLLGFGPHR